jgi:hypothetical protein
MDTRDAYSALDSIGTLSLPPSSLSPLSSLAHLSLSIPLSSISHFYLFAGAVLNDDYYGYDGFFEKLSAVGFQGSSFFYFILLLYPHLFIRTLT